MNLQASETSPDFDPRQLDAYLKDWLGGSAGTRIRRTSGGMSKWNISTSRSHFPKEKTD